MDIFCQAKTILKHCIVHETKHFLLLHDGFPLAEGHLFIIPKEHINCFLNLPNKNKKEYERLVHKTICFLKTFYQKPILFEHGVIAQTIPHAHLHFLPTSKSILKKIRLVADLIHIPQVPYLMYGKWAKLKFFKVTKSVELGFLHKTFAKELKRPLILQDRAQDGKLWTAIVKKKWNLWQGRG